MHVLTVCVLALAVAAAPCGFLLAASERRKRWLSDRRRREANRRCRQAERGFVERMEQLREADVELYRFDCRYQVLGAWAIEEGRPIDLIAVEQNSIMKTRLLIDQWSREPDAVTVGSRVEQRWRRNGTGDD